MEIKETEEEPTEKTNKLQTSFHTHNSITDIDVLYPLNSYRRMKL